jgi:uncharacterized protein
MDDIKISRTVPLKNVRITDAFWSGYQELISRTVLPYQWDVINDKIKDIEPSHAVRNFRITAGLEEGEFYGFVFQDTDVAKWLETLSYSLINYPNPGLEKLADEVIDIIGKAQQEDGYLNTYFTIKEPGKRWTNLQDCHELYTAGHFIEASVAYYNATGKRKFLDIMCRFADLIGRTFGKEQGKIKGYCGHPEIELALIRLYEASGEKRYLDLAGYFIDERGSEPYFFHIEAEKRGVPPGLWNADRKYYQAHLPVRKQTTAEGHAVRFTYLYSAAADVAGLTGDSQLLDVCRKIWNNITTKRMYITGGIGSAASGESLTCDYDLPNDTMYTETCASVGMVMFAFRMLKIEPDIRYSDVMELQIYNGALDGISLDGTRYFYVNPLDVWTEAVEKNPTYKHVKPVRQTWYACACCPTNITRLIASLGQYIYTIKDDGIYVHLYTSGETSLEVGGKSVIIRQETGYPRDEKINIKISVESNAVFSVFLRIPGWCDHYICKVNNEIINVQSHDNGYLEINRVWFDEDSVELFLEMPVRLMQSNPKVRRNRGKAAIQRGPVIYCLEEIDNGSNLHDLVMPSEQEFTSEFDKNLLGGVMTINGTAYRSDENSWSDDKLYSSLTGREKLVKIKAIPYSMWCNRKPGEMIVWINITL